VSHRISLHSVIKIGLKLLNLELNRMSLLNRFKRLRKILKSLTLKLSQELRYFWKKSNKNRESLEKNRLLKSKKIFKSALFILKLITHLFRLILNQNLKVMLEILVLQRMKDCGNFQNKRK